MLCHAGFCGAQRDVHMLEVVPSMMRARCYPFDMPTLPIKGPMEEAGVIKLYELSPTQCLYVAPVENMSG